MDRMGFEFNIEKLYPPICLKNAVMYPLRDAFASSTGAANVVASPELMKIISMHKLWNPILKGFSTYIRISFIHKKYLTKG